MKRLVFLCLLLGALTGFSNELLIPQVKNLPEAGKWTASHYNRALVISGAVSIGRNRGIPRLDDCQLRLLHDGKNLACHFLVQIPRNTKLLAAKKKRDSEVDKDDSVELFFTPGGKMDPVHQIVVNSIGNVLDLRVLQQVQEDIAWNCKGLKVAARVQRGFWSVQYLIPLKELGITPNKVFRFNAAVNDRFRARNVHWSLAPVKAGFRDYQRQFLMRLGDLKTPGKFHLANPYAETLFDGHFEYDIKGVRKEGSVYRSRYRQYDGLYSLMFTAKKGGVVPRITHSIPIKDGEKVRIFGAVHLFRVEKPDFSPARVEFCDSKGKILKKEYAPGLGNMGGSSTPDQIHRICEFTAEAPKGASRAAMVWDLEGTTGAMRIDAVSFRKNFAEWSSPRLLSPSAGMVSRKNDLVFRWNADAAARKGTSQILEIARKPDFKKDVLRYSNVVSGKKVTLKGIGKWYWRVGVSNGKVCSWSPVSSVTLHITAKNEKNRPIVTSMLPYGLQKKLPSQLVIRYEDPGISSGIDVKNIVLTVNGKNVTKECTITKDRLTWRIPSTLKAGVPLHYNILVRDRNSNSLRRYGWFVYGKGGSTRLDKEGFICYNGKRVFPVAMYGMSRLGIYGKLKGGFMTLNFCPWANGELLIAHLEEAARNGIYVVAYTPGNHRVLSGAVAPHSPAGKALEKSALSLPERIKDHPNLLGFFIGDENMDSQGAKPEHVRAWYRKLKEIAPNQLVYWLPTYQLRDKKRVSAAVGACDLIVWHDYSYTRRNVLRVVETADAVRAATNNMPNFFLPEAYGDLPPRALIRFQSFLGIISQSRGLSFYTDYKRRDLTKKDPYADSHFPNYLQEVYAVSKELSSLSRVLTANDRKDFYKVIAEEGSLRTVGKVVNNKYYIFAVNAAKPLFKGRIAGNWKKVTVNGKKAVVKNGAVELELKSTGSLLIVGEK